MKCIFETVGDLPEAIEQNGIISVSDFVKLVEIFGFEHPIVTAVWNTMCDNPNNIDEFETVYAMWAAGRFK